MPTFEPPIRARLTPRVFAMLLLASVFPALAAAAEPRPTGATTVTSGVRSTQNVPDPPAALLAKLNRYQNTRSASMVGFAPVEAGGGVLILTRFGDSAQLHQVHRPMGAREQLTFFDEPVRFAVPVHDQTRPAVILGMDQGGSEFWQLYRFELLSRETTLLTDGKSRNQSPLVSADGRWLAYASTARNGRDTDVLLLDLAQGGEARTLTNEEGSWFPTSFSADGKSLSVMRYVAIDDARPAIVDLDTGKLSVLPVDGGKAGFSGFVLGREPGSAIYASDEPLAKRPTEFRQLRRHRRGSSPQRLGPVLDWDIDEFVLDRSGTRLAAVANVDGRDELHVIDLASGDSILIPDLPAGLIGLGEFSADGRQLGLALSTSTSPGDAQVLDLATRRLTAWTASEVGGLDRSAFVTPELVRYPTFDKVNGAPRQIPAFVYRPAAGGPHPVIIQIHGGPESQARAGFDPITQFLVRELGVAVVIPNVRGSSGYGKSSLALDNGVLREDSVRDIGALLDWIAKDPGLDADRVGVYGGSYGGYMVLATMANYPERVRAGIDIVGISSFTTFLANTQDYRRDLRRAEYGDERDEAVRRVLDEISPLNRASKIKAPLFVMQGANDPRVPASEAHQIVEKVRAAGGTVAYLEFADEGHGFAKKANRDFANAAAIEFWQQHLLPETAAKP